MGVTTAASIDHKTGKVMDALKDLAEQVRVLGDHRISTVLDNTASLLRQVLKDPVSLRIETPVRH